MLWIIDDEDKLHCYKQWIKEVEAYSPPYLLNTSDEPYDDFTGGFSVSD